MISWPLLEFFFSQKLTTSGVKEKKHTQTSNWDGMGFLVGSGLTVVHFFLSWELTSTTRLSFAHLIQTESELAVMSFDCSVTLQQLISTHVLNTRRHSRVSCFRRAILLVFVCLAELAVSPALATDKHHLQIWRPKPFLWTGKLLVKYN